MDAALQHNRQEAGQARVLLLNMGGPASLDAVEPYIASLLGDPDMVRLPLGGLLQQPFARMVARRRAPKVRERYKLIGGASPLEAATARQAELLAAELGLPVDYAMRYTPPRVAEVLGRSGDPLAAHWVVIPLYPQYSTVSTLSALKDFRAQAPPGLRYSVVDRHFSAPGYIRALKLRLGEALAECEPGLNTHIVFAAHSIPESYIRRGDPYADEIEATARLVREDADDGLKSTLGYQSRVGPVKWRGPTLGEVLAELVADGVQQLVVQPLSFVCENLETLFDLDIDFREECAAAGISNFARARTVDAAPEYISALAELARGALAEGGGSNA
jgi:ferrochelatase